ncbi:MAG: hypothetical protein H0U74_09145 [Bradymonadaceae bacterium]|nr:hypothetical protein [Lujinxingiaceae bacterium]
MFDVVDEHVSARQMTSGRWSVSFRGIEKAALALGPAAEDIVRLAREAAAVAIETFELEQRYRRDRLAGTARGDAQEIDNDSDRALGAFYRGIEEFVRNYGSNHPLAVAARALLKAFFAYGLKAVVHQPFEDQLAAMERIVRLGQTDYAAQIAQLGLGHWFERIVALTDLYRAELEANRLKPVTWPEIKAARKRCHRYGQRVIAAVAYILGEDVDLEKRNEVLEPLTLQQRAVLAMQRSRRRVTDVDPHTGVEIESEGLDVLESDQPELA